MKDIIKESFQHILKDRYLLFLFVFTSIYTVGFLIFIAVNVRPSELQLVSHYTAFGPTHLYRDQWYYLFIFGLFAVITSCLHAILAIKVLLAKGRELAIIVGWAGVVLVTFAWMTAYAVFNIWSPVI